MAKKSFAFRPSARLQRYLGKELIADPNLAILEFVKNAYDAGANEVFVDFQIAKADTSQLLIADNGTGMDQATFERNWMHPGYSEKSRDFSGRGASPSRSAASKRQSNRVMAGEKGLGRLAAGRLGRTLEVFTRSSRHAPWLHVIIDWGWFDDMGKMIDEIQVPFDHATIPAAPPFESGTLLVIQGLNMKWEGRTRGRPMAGRSRTRLGRLKQDLELLIRPLSALDQDFTIHLGSDQVAEADDIGDISPQSAARRSEFRYDFEFSVDARGAVKIHRRLFRGHAISEELGGALSERLPIVTVTPAVARDEGRPATLESGPFSGQFFYSPPAAGRRAKEIDAVGSGVLLYRDGILVEPYGLDGNDWVGASARKAQRQGYALVQPATFSGYVLIGRDENSTLLDMSNRLGLIENEASEEFIQHVRAEFLHFEATIAPELKKRWESIEEKAGKQAEESADLSQLRIRALAHLLGQPLVGLGADILSLRNVAHEFDMPEDLRGVLSELAESAAAHLMQAESVIARMRTSPNLERVKIDVGTLVNDAVVANHALGDSLGVNLIVHAAPAREVLVQRELVVEALGMLIANAVEATNDVGGESVEIGFHEVDGDVVIDVLDEAGGIPGAAADEPLSSIGSTKGRPGEGLATAEVIVRASRGRVRIASTGPAGTHMEVYLPDRLAGLRTPTG